MDSIQKSMASGSCLNLRRDCKEREKEGKRKSWEKGKILCWWGAGMGGRLKCLSEGLKKLCKMGERWGGREISREFVRKATSKKINYERSFEHE